MARMLENYLNSRIPSRLKTDFSTKVALGIVGAQSNELGNSSELDGLGVNQRTSLSAPSQGIYEPLKLAPSGYGSMFTEAAELLAHDGIKVDLYNGAVGSSSGITDWCGTIAMAGRVNSKAYRGKRASLNAGDPGHRGHCIYVNGATWEATTGNRHLVFTSSLVVMQPSATDGVVGASVSYWSDPGTVIREVNLITAASPPTFPGSPVVGNTVTDGDIIWTCLSVAAKTTDSASTHVMRHNEDGFDPYFMCKRVRDALMATNVSVRKRFVYLQNGQTDAGTTAVLYTQALVFIARFFGDSPYEINPIFGLSYYYPGGSVSGYDTLEAVLSNTDILTPPDFANSPLTLAMIAGGYYYKVPGSTIQQFSFYHGQSLYRYFGTDVAYILGMAVGQPHSGRLGSRMGGRALYPTLSKILRNSAK